MENIRLTETRALRLPDEPQERRNQSYAVEEFSATLRGSFIDELAGVPNSFVKEFVLSHVNSDTHHFRLHQREALDSSFALTRAHQQRISNGRAGISTLVCDMRVTTTFHQRTLEASELSRLNSDVIGVSDSSNDDPVTVLVEWCLHARLASHVRGSNPGTAIVYALLMSPNESETRVQCFPLV
ncbi:hypothetical protein T265_11406 [Opisthorchis viverrini]|uniref:Uncharacterized protein n=1 Tax=Opisthorchis viverrini TaxID=6198 RepID=A0A074YZ37_OPIVI|nr:hypothetical protein T265_11406 [Opisthorchis viverrini]KER19938.1 hypothetical protein T265_11406 [Opisthorchis viverrini]